MPTEKKTGLQLPGGILQPTTPPEPVPAEEDDARAAEPEAVATSETPAGEPKGRGVRRKVRRADGPAKKLEGRRIYLSEDVHFRLRMLAYQRGQKLSEVCEDVLDKSLPKWKVDRHG